MTTQNPKHAFALLKNGATHDYIGEDITQLAHALQCAHLAEIQTGDFELIMAALFHDIGHLLEYKANSDDDMQGLGHRHHEDVGADFLLQLGFSKRIAKLVREHVQAKRYLTATNAQYASQLSEASRRTLALQGGPMTKAEVRSFESDPDFRDMLRVRVWDEKGKVLDAATPSLEYYEKLFFQNAKCDSMMGEQNSSSENKNFNLN
jgi:putative nucleotidyltransferase with HDIG domain